MESKKLRPILSILGTCDEVLSSKLDSLNDSFRMIDLLMLDITRLENEVSSFARRV